MECHASAAPLRRPCKALPLELREQIVMYLEEQMYVQAIDLLYNLLVSTASAPAAAGAPLFAPSPAILALLGTLTVHPSTTTRATSSDASQASRSSLRFLTTLQDLVDASSAQLGAAYVFAAAAPKSSLPQRRRRKRKIAREQDLDSGVGTDPSSHSDIELGEDVDTEINNELAHDRSLYNSADGLWHAVGWAFVCSIKHPHRWNTWRPWLGYMLDVIESDWQQRFQRAKASIPLVDGRDPDLAVVETELLRTSMISTYIEEASDKSRTAWRRILKAIFADGSEKSILEFREIWRNECKPPKRPTGADTRNWNKVKVEGKGEFHEDEWDFGDYLDQDDDDASPQPTKKDGGLRTSKRVKREANMGKGLGMTNWWQDMRDDANGQDPDIYHGDSDGASERVEESIDTLGGAEALQLRKRFLVLLVQASRYLPKTFAPLYDLLDLFVEFINPLPLPIFAQMVLPTPKTSPLLTDVAAFDPFCLAGLHQHLLGPLCGKDSKSLERAWGQPQQATVEMLGLRANSASAVDNAKVALVFEGMLRNLPSLTEVQAEPKLDRALEAGIDSRLDKVSGRGKKGNKADEAEGEAWLASTHERMRFTTRYMQP